MACNIISKDNYFEHILLSNTDITRAIPIDLPMGRSARHLRIPSIRSLRSRGVVALARAVSSEISSLFHSS